MIDTPKPVETLPNGTLRVNLAGRDPVVFRRFRNVAEMSELAELAAEVGDVLRERLDPIRAKAKANDDERIPLHYRNQPSKSLRQSIYTLRVASHADEDSPEWVLADPDLLDLLEVALKAGPLDDDEHARLDRLVGENARLMNDLRATTVEALLPWWVRALKLLGDVEAEPDDLDPGLGEDSTLIHEVMTHLRTVPPPRGG